MSALHFSFFPIISSFSTQHCVTATGSFQPSPLTQSPSAYRALSLHSLRYRLNSADAQKAINDLMSTTAGTGLGCQRRAESLTALWGRGGNFRGKYTFLEHKYFAISISTFHNHQSKQMIEE